MLNITMRINNITGLLLTRQPLFSAFRMYSLPEKHLLLQGHCEEDKLLSFKDLNSSPSPDIQFSHERGHQDRTSPPPTTACCSMGRGEQAYGQSLLYEGKLYTSFRNPLVYFHCGDTTEVTPTVRKETDIPMSLWPLAAFQVRFLELCRLTMQTPEPPSRPL